MATGLPKSTVNRWLQELREERRRQVAENPEIIADAVAHYKAVYAVPLPQSGPVHGN